MQDDLDEEDYAGFNTAEGDDDPTIVCPHCGADVYDEAEQCPACGWYLSREDVPAQSKSRQPWWIVIGVVICILIVIAWMLGG